MAKIIFYTNESVDVAVADGLKRRGVKVVSARDAGNLGLSDGEQLEYARKNNFVIITHDNDLLLMAVEIKHKGIVYVHQESSIVLGILIRMLRLLWDIAEQKTWQTTWNFYKSGKSLIMRRKCLLLRLGIMEFGEAWKLQKSLLEDRMSNAIEDCLILLQHPPTFTYGRRYKEDNLITNKEYYGSLGFAVYKTDRGDWLLITVLAK